MGKLLQSIITKLQDLDQRRQEPAPDYSDPHEALAYIKRRNAEAYERKELSRKLVLALRSLPKAQQDAFYTRCVLPAARPGFTKAQFEDYLNPASENGRKEFSWILKENTYGQSWHRAIETLEGMLGPEAVERLSEETDALIAPTNPLYPDEDKLVYPMNDEIEEIKNSLNVFDPDMELKARMLDEVKEDLAYVSDDVRNLIDQNDQGQNGVTGYQSMVNRANYDMQNRFLRQDLAEGKFGDKFKTLPSSDATDHFFYDMDDVDLGEDGLLQPADVEEMRQVKPQVPKEIKDDVESICTKMDELGENNFRNKHTSGIHQGGTEQDTFFFSEQGVKLYTYWPLYVARTELAAAVREKDVNKIWQAHTKYKETRQKLDEMLQIVHKHPTGISEGNVNATRPLAAATDAINPLPLNHMEDYVGQSQLNGLFCFYALSKNTKATPKQLLEDPIKVMTEAGKRHVEKFGLGSRQKTGEKLYWALSGTACDLMFDREWGNGTGQLCNRGFNAVACLSNDPAERARISGTGMLAIASGTIPVKEHCKKWHKLTNCSKEQRTLLYQHAVLLPENEFKPMNYAEAFGQPDWKQQLDTGALIDRLKQEGKLDYGQLADRVKGIIEETKVCNKEVDTAYTADGLIDASHTVFKEVLKKASAEERETEGYKKLETYTKKMLLDMSSFKRGQRSLEEEMDVQKEDKKGLFLSSENSEEQKKMMRAQNTFRYKLLQMQGKELPAGVSEENKNYLKTISLEQAYRIARNATFDYCAKKTDNGRSRFFVHDTGRDRFDAAENSLKIMDLMATKLELRTPAQKLIDETRKEVFDKRRSGEWTAEKAEIAAAKIMYATTLEHQHVSPEEQQARLNPNRLEMGIHYIRGQEAFRKMVRSEGAGKVADYVVEGHGKLTDAYVRGMNGAARDANREAGKDPKQMTEEEKREVWKNQALMM